MHGSRKLCQRGPTLTTFFLCFFVFVVVVVFKLMRGRVDQSITISGTSSARQGFAGVPMIAQH